MKRERVVFWVELVGERVHGRGAAPVIFLAEPFGALNQGLGQGLFVVRHAGRALEGLELAQGLVGQRQFWRKQGLVAELGEALEIDAGALAVLGLRRGVTGLVRQHQIVGREHVGFFEGVGGREPVAAIAGLFADLLQLGDARLYGLRRQGRDRALARAARRRRDDDRGRSCRRRGRGGGGPSRVSPGFGRGCASGIAGGIRRCDLGPSFGPSFGPGFAFGRGVTRGRHWLEGLALHGGHQVLGRLRGLVG